MTALAHAHRIRPAFCAALACAAAPALAQTGPMQTLQTVTVQGHYLNAVGTLATPPARAA